MMTKLTSLYLDDLSLKNDYVHLSRDSVQLDGQALYREENAVLKVTIPPQAALIEILKAIFHL